MSNEILVFLIIKTHKGWKMELFIDTAEIDEIKSLNVTGLIDGVTTNPSLIAKSGRNIIETIEEICNGCQDP